MDERLNKSPLRFYTEMQTKKLSQRIANNNLIVDFAMRYGNPSIKSKIDKMHKDGCEKLNYFSFISTICITDNSHSL